MKIALVQQPAGSDRQANREKGLEAVRRAAAGTDDRMDPDILRNVLTEDVHGMVHELQRVECASAGVGRSPMGGSPEELEGDGVQRRAAEPADAVGR